jgi:hypothetical protein
MATRQTKAKEDQVRIDPIADREAKLRAELAEIEAGKTKDALYDKSFRVEVVGTTGKARGDLPAAIVDRCCDESEAKRLYFARAGITDTHHFNVQVTRVEPENPPKKDEDLTKAPTPEEAVTLEPVESPEEKQKREAKEEKAAQKEAKK